MGLQYQITPEFPDIHRLRAVVGARVTSMGQRRPWATSTSDGPERTHDVELGAKYSGRIFDRSAQNQRCCHLQSCRRWGTTRLSILHDQVELTSSLTLERAAGVRVNGVEVDGQIRALDWLTLGGAGAFAHATYPKGGVVVAGQPTEFSNYQDTPRWTGDAFTTVSLPTPGEWGWNVDPRGRPTDQTPLKHSPVCSTASRRVHCFPPTRSSTCGGIGPMSWVRNLPSRPTSRILPTARTTSVVSVSAPTCGFNTAVAGAPRQYGAELTFKF